MIQNRCRRKTFYQAALLLIGWWDCEEISSRNRGNQWAKNLFFLIQSTFAPIQSIYNPFYYKSNPFKIHLMNLDFNLIYILYILWIEYPFYKSRFLNMDNPNNPIQIFNLNF